MTMPEEINRVLTDRISDIFLLQQSTRMKIWLEGVDRSVHLVGNTMIDTLIVNQEKTIPPRDFKTKVNLFL